MMRGPALTGLPGKVISPGTVVLLHVVTLGIYGLFYWWNRTREIDAATGQRRAHPITKAAVFLLLFGIVAIFVVLFVGIFLAVGAAFGSSSGPDTFGELLAAGLVFMLLLLLAAGIVIAANVLWIIGQYRLWTQTREVEQRMGSPRPTPVGLLLVMSILSVVLGGGGNSSQTIGAAIIEGILVLLSLFLWLTVAYRTQVHLNGIWQGRPAS